MYFLVRQEWDNSFFIPWVAKVGQHLAQVLGRQNRADSFRLAFAFAHIICFRYGSCGQRFACKQFFLRIEVL